MPFCTECGARHADGARVCPNCGEPIFEPPTDDDLDDIVASLDDGADLGDELPEAAPSAGPPTADYMEQIDEVRSQIAAQSTSLQTLTELSWSNPQAVQIRDQLAQALARLHALNPPAPLAAGHADFVEGAELLAAGFNRLVDAAQRGNARDAVAEAEMAIAEATNRFLRGADALNEYFTLQEAGLADDPLPAVPQVDDAATDEDDEELPDLDEIPPPPSFDDLDLPEDEPASPASTPAFLSSAPLAPEPVFAPTPAFAPPPVAAPLPAYSPPPTFGADADYSAEAQASAWAGLGDPATDTLLVEIESAWVRARPQVHEAIERAIRSAVVDALRASLGTRVRIEQDARATLERIAADRNRLIDEVESLRRDAHALQSELAELRRSLNELERERQIAQERRQQMFADAEAHRAQLLREIEQLGGQLDSMRQNIVSLLNMSSSVPAQLAAAISEPPAAAPRAPAPRPAADGPTTTEVRIAGVNSLGKNLQIQQAIKALPGVTVEGQPKYRNGVITATLRHPADFDVADALGSLTDQPLSLTGSPEPGVLELAAT